MMRDRFGREINYLRISVTDRCNLRCVYCMPEGGVPLLQRNEVLSFEEIYEFAKTAAEMGVTKIRLTGGEPLVREDVADLIEMLASIRGVTDLAMTTNGILLAQFAESLRLAGLMRVNVSLDTINHEKYSLITRGGELKSAIRGIDAAISAGLLPVKINCVVERSADEEDAKGVAWFAGKRRLEVRYIRAMNLPEGKFYKILGGAGGDCNNCGKLRLTANGLVRPCLFSDLAFGVRQLGAREAIMRAIVEKPESGMSCATAPMSAIGG